MTGTSLVPVMVITRFCGADIAVAVVDLGDVGEGERVACAQPVEVGSGRVVVPADGLLLAIGGERIES